MAQTNEKQKKRKWILGVIGAVLLGGTVFGLIGGYTAAAVAKPTIETKTNVVSVSTASDQNNLLLVSTSGKTAADADTSYSLSYLNANSNQMFQETVTNASGVALTLNNVHLISPNLTATELATLEPQIEINNVGGKQVIELNYSQNQWRTFLSANNLATVELMYQIVLGVGNKIYQTTSPVWTVQNVLFTVSNPVAIENTTMDSVQYGIVYKDFSFNSAQIEQAYYQFQYIPASASGSVTSLVTQIQQLRDKTYSASNNNSAADLTQLGWKSLTVPEDDPLFTNGTKDNPNYVNLQFSGSGNSWYYTICLYYELKINNTNVWVMSQAANYGTAILGQ